LVSKWVQKKKNLWMALIMLHVVGVKYFLDWNEIPGTPIHHQKNGESAFKVLCSRFNVAELKRILNFFKYFETNIEH
jgi:hypothetical protein